MGFVQIIEYRSSQPDKIRPLEEEWLRGTEGERTARRIIVCRDHHDPNRHVEIVFFDSYQSAMANSNLPETSRFAEQIAKLVDEEMMFDDLEVVEDRTV